MNIHLQFFKTAIGELQIASFQGEICCLDYRYRKARTAVDARIEKGLNAKFVAQHDPANIEAYKQVTEYLNGERKAFDFPIKTVGTPFQQSVWQALQHIPFGQTRSYNDLAIALGDKKAIRAVAAANGANAIAVVIPCHRIIGSDGTLVGYAGGLAAKQKLLTLEASSGVQHQLDF